MPKAVKRACAEPFWGVSSLEVHGGGDPRGPGLREVHGSAKGAGRHGPALEAWVDRLSDRLGTTEPALARFLALFYLIPLPLRDFVCAPPRLGDLLSK